VTPTLVFDIETIPDVTGLRKLHQLGDKLSDHDVAEYAFQRRRQQTSGDFLQLHLHRVIAISCALRAGKEFKVWSLGTAQDSEATLIQRFYDGIEKYTPQIVSWNGGGFDLPVLHYRGLINGVTAARYWDMGEEDKDFKWNNYISRYHSRHLDLMDLLAMYQPRANAPLDDLAQLMGLPGKLGMDGSKVWDAYQAGEIAAIRNYCETDVVNTYLVFLRFQKMRDVYSDEQFQKEMELVRTTQGKSGEAHWKEFLGKWPAAK
jgi:3'-5' exonuclease